MKKEKKEKKETEAQRTKRLEKEKEAAKKEEARAAEKAKREQFGAAKKALNSFVFLGPQLIYIQTQKLFNIYRSIDINNILISRFSIFKSYFSCRDHPQTQDLFSSCPTQPFSVGSTVMRDKLF